MITARIKKRDLLYRARSGMDTALHMRVPGVGKILIGAANRVREEKTRTGCSQKKSPPCTGGLIICDYVLYLVLGARVELARPCGRWILSPLRLPIPPSEHS